AMTLGDRLAVMRDGLLQQVGSPDDLYNRPVNIFVAGFIGSPAMNFLSGEVADGQLRFPLASIPLRNGALPGLPTPPREGPAAVAWAISTLCSSRSSRLIEPAAVVAWVMLVGLLITAPIAIAEGVPDSLNASSGGWLALAGIGNVVGLVFTYGALRLGQVALVAPLVSTEGAIAAVIALAAGETLAPRVGVTLGAIAIGIGLSSLPPPVEAAAVENLAPA